jgi:hypothetical protein
MINREKSAIFFSKNCSHEMKEVVRVLDIHKEALVEKYLGLPTEVGYATSGVFEYLRAQVRGTIDGWCVREASCAGREVLIKSVAQAVPANFHHTLCWRCVQTTLEN